MRLPYKARGGYDRTVGHPPRIPVWLQWEQAVVYFVTFCVADRRKVLANDKSFDVFKQALTRLSEWQVIAAVMMPDHVHLLAAPNDREAKVGNLSGAIKRWMRQSLGPEWNWQPGCFDRLLRRDESVEGKWNYIRENPVRAGLAESWEKWPYRIGFEL
jgi:putative transposase